MFSRLVGSLKKRGTGGNGSPRVSREMNPNFDGDVEDTEPGSSEDESDHPARHSYSRPDFLQLSADEEKKLTKHQTRTIIVPKDTSHVPLGAGYAECINGGKSEKNEDQAAVATFILPNQPNGLVDNKEKAERIDVHYFGIFDGHAGPGAALMAADQLINHLQEKLVLIQEDLSKLKETSNGCDPNPIVSFDSLVRGTLEAAFVSFDEQIARERQSFCITGGCAAIVTLILMNKVYVAHAGDCRAVAYVGDEMIELGTEFTPETDSERIQCVAHLKPALTQEVFSDNFFIKNLHKRDVGTRILCRAPQRSGWFYKEVTEKDVQLQPLVTGRGKWARLMGTIGVTRGFGDHGLVIPGTKIKVKPFLTPIPEVRVLNLEHKELTEDDVLVMGCDGLWDLLSNEQMRSRLKESLEESKEEKNPHRYTKAAYDLVWLARGDNCGKGWRMKDDGDASFDDITVFVIPLHKCVTNTDGV